MKPYKIELLPNQHKRLKRNKKTTPEAGVVCFGTARLANTEPIMRLKLMIYAT